MLHIQIDTGSGVPAYRQVMDQIKLYVVSGVLAEGVQLPSIRELARSLAVNPSTVVKAYSELEHEGVVARRQGRGVFVESVGRGLTRRARRELLRPLAQRLVVEARQLELGEDELKALLSEELAGIAKQRRGHESGD